MGAPEHSQTRAAAEAVARQSYGKLVAFLAVRSRDVTAAEDALADAFAAALGDWPRTGIPDKPEAWLLAVARRKSVDAVRRAKTRDAAVADLLLLGEEMESEAAEIPDQRLALMFACAHPAMDESVRAPLILQTILGFDAVAIGSAFLVAPAAMGQRLVRAKQKIKQAAIPFRVPGREELDERLDAVLEAIYATFTEGWSDPTGSEARQRNLTEEGIWLGRLTASLLPDAPEALGLLALMLYADARRTARRDDAGEYVPLPDQDTTRWDASMIREAERLLTTAGKANKPGRYQLEAAIQSAHVVRRVSGYADWAAIENLYRALHALTGSPVVAINRSIAIAEIAGPAAGLDVLDTLSEDKRLRDYQPYWAARAELLARAGRRQEAVHAYQMAIGLESDPAVRRFLQRRSAELGLDPC